MKKTLPFPIIAFLLAVIFLAPHPVFADTITDALMEQARVEGERINAVQRALWLRWLDQYNQYIADLTAGVASPAAPAWSTSMAAIASYLPTGFPAANYALALSGDEITVTRSGLTPEVAMYVPLYVPLATLPDATTARLLVTRPTTFVGTEALTKSMVRNSGLPVDPMTSTTFLPGANVTFGNGASMEMQSNGRLEFTDNNGRILGVNELEASRIVPVNAATGLTLAANTSITGDLSVTGQVQGDLRIAGQIQGGSLHIGGPTRFLDVTVNNTTGVVTFSGSSFAFNNSISALNGTFFGSLSTAGPISMQGQTLDDRYLRTDVRSKLDTTLDLGTGGFYLDKDGDAKLKAVIANTLQLNGRTGTSENPYNVWVENAKNANYATSAGNAATVGGFTADQLVAKATAPSLKLIDQNGILKSVQVDNYTYPYQFKYAGDSGTMHFVRPAAWNKLLNTVIYPLGYESVQIGTQGAKTIVTNATVYGNWGVRRGSIRLIGSAPIYEIRRRSGVTVDTSYKINLGIPAGTRNIEGVRYVIIPTYRIDGLYGDGSDTNYTFTFNNCLLTWQSVTGIGTDYLPLGGPITIYK